MRPQLAILLLLFTLLSCGAEPAWKFSDMPYRTGLPWRPADGRSCEISLDFEILSRLAKQTVPADLSSVRLAAVTPDGVEEVPAALTGRDGTTLHLRFVLPEKTANADLYFGGGKKPGNETVPSVDLIPGALRPEGWTPAKGKWTVRAQDGGLFLQTPQLNSAEIRKDFPVPADLAPGSPVVLDFAFRSLAGISWNFSLRVRQLDSEGRELPSSATDPRWSTMYTVGGKETANRVRGQLDPRAKTLRLALNVYTPPAGVDRYGKPIPNSRKEGMSAVLMKLQLRAARQIPFPGRNPDCFTEGVNGGKAFRLNGKHAPFFNANPPCVWSENVGKLTAQEDYHWSRGDGTFEAWIKPEFTPADRENTIVDVYQNYRKSLLNLVYRPQEKRLILSILDFAGRKKTLTADRELPARKWSHIAVCWSKERGIALFLDGTVVASDPSFRYTPADLEHAERCDSIMPDNISLGVAAGPVRSIPEKMGPEQFLKGALDQVRFSVGARYTAGFTPSRNLSNDGQTCAFFDYEDSFDGVHGGGDRFIAGSVLAFDPPYADVLTVERREGSRVLAESVRVFPRDIVPENHPRNTLPVCNYTEMPSVRDFHAAREMRTRSFPVGSGEKIRFTIPEKVYMNWLEIACPENGKPLVGPILLNKNDPDIRSYGDLAETMFPPDGKAEDDHQRAIRLFSFMIRSSDYFMSHQARIDGNNALNGAEYDGLRQLAGYCGFECGPLNNLTMNMFVYVLGLPASMTSGNFHLFEQVFYNGGWRLFDLSAQTYFPSRRKNDAASLEEIEEDPALLVKQNAYHFYRLCARSTVPWGLLPQKRQIYTLNPGESFRVHWQNNGVYNDLQRVQPRFARSMGDCGRDVTKETGVGTVRPGESVRQFDRPFPHYASGFLRFEGAVSVGNPAFSNVSGDSFTYRVKLPYPVVAASYRAEGDGLSYELSYDNGKSWRKVSVSADGVCRLTLEVRARYEYLLRVTGSRSGKFRAETNVQMNPRVLAGALHQGENELAFKSDQPGRATITCSYRVDTGKEIVLGNVLCWGAIPGEEKQMVPLNPGEPYEITVSGLSPSAELRTSDGITAERDGNRIRLSASGRKARLGGLTIRDGNRIKHLVAAVLPGSRWIPANAMRPDRGAELLPPDGTRTMPVLKSNRSGVNVVYPFAPVKAGNYMVFHIGRNPLNVNLSHLVRRVEDGKIATSLVRKTNNSAEFYKVEKLLWRFRWDYPVSGVYPYEMMQPLSFPACDSMTVRYQCPELEIAGCLLIPADDPQILSEFRKYCSGFNYQPMMFQ